MFKDKLTWLTLEEINENNKRIYDRIKDKNISFNHLTNDSIDITEIGYNKENKIDSIEGVSLFCERCGNVLSDEQTICEDCKSYPKLSNYIQDLIKIQSKKNRHNDKQKESNQKVVRDIKRSLN